MDDSSPEELSWPQPKPQRDDRNSKKPIEIDMNPMVDLAFLLLTFFMLATTFSKPQVMELVMPVLPDPEDAINEQAVKESQALTIILGENDELLWFRGVTEPQVGRDEFSTATVSRLLREMKDQVGEPVILIKPEPNARYENLIDLLDEINLIGLKRYAITDFDANDYKILRQIRQSDE